jgi:4-amino-4-deoxy-L-arabinose transferase-like glycosyltransferase
MNTKYIAKIGPPSSFLKKNWHLAVLFLIALLSFGLNFYAISKIGYGNAYYAAAIKSMTESFKNFFYVAFDPAGLVSVDKPPLGLWIQAVFVLIFGYHGWAMLLPQALAGTGACLMMYKLTSKYFGHAAGLISALVFALTPAAVVAARNNTMDMQLIFVLLVAAWFLFKSIETSKWRYLFICAVFVGLGFNIKMLQAYMILPAVVIVYLVFAKEKIIKRFAAGIISLVIMAVISFAWVAAVDLTPAGSRPYVGSSTNNTVAELIIGHNGLERLYGGSGGGGPGMFGGNNADGGMNRNSGGPGGSQGGNPGTLPNQSVGTGNPTSGDTAQMPDNRPSGQSFGGGPNANSGAGGGQPGGTDGGMGGGQPGGGMGGGTGGGAGGSGNDIGTAGLLRLWSSSLYGQAAWLIVLALFCILAKLGKFSFKKMTVQQGVFIFWIIWLVTMYTFFSFAGFWHRYYLCMFAPAIAGLAGIGVPEMVKAFRDRHGWKQFLLPVSLLGTFAPELIYVWSYTALRAWLAPVMLAAAAASLMLMALHYIKPKNFILLTASALMLVSLLAAPLYWSLTVVLYVEQNSTLPYAGPELASTAAIRGMTPNQEVLTSGDSGTNALEDYLVAHYKAGSYLVVSQRANDVAQFIVDTGLPAVAYGGFLGSDNAMTLDQLKTLVSEGKVTYFMITSQNSGRNSDLTSYVEKTATLIDSSEYLGTTAQSGGGSSSGGISGSSLYLFS